MGAQTFPKKIQFAPTSFPMKLRPWTQMDASGDGDLDLFDGNTGGKPRSFNPRLSGKAKPAADAITGKGSTEEHLPCRFSVDTVTPGDAPARMTNQYHKRGITSPAHSSTCSCLSCRTNGFDPHHPSNVRYADKFNVNS